MSALSQAVLSICLSAVAVGLIEMLLPHDSYQAPMKLITGCVLLISILLPFTGVARPVLDIDYTLHQPDYSALEQVAAMSVKQAIAEIAAQHDIGAATVIVYTSQQDGSVAVEKAAIMLNRTDIEKGSAAAAQCERELGIDVIIGEG